jgi:hypothetical protein
MKKLIFIAIMLAVGVTFAHSQGTISLNITTAEVYTNNGGFGPVVGPANSWYFEVLDMTQSQWNSLTVGQQAGAADLLANEADVSLWTDSTVSGVNSTLHAGGIIGLGGAAGTSAANWAAPTSNTGYNTAPNYDYYTIVGWSASFGSSWSTIAEELQDGTLLGLGDLGQTAVAYNYAGGGSGGLSAVNVFSSSAFTGLPGSGGLPSTAALVFSSIPEPTTLALAGLGGLSMLFLRRRKI